MNADEIRKVKENACRVDVDRDSVQYWLRELMEVQYEVAAQVAELKEIMREMSFHVEAVTKNL